jgi:hypothetical protein
MAEKLRLQNALRQKQKSALRRERQINFFGNKGAVMIGLPFVPLFLEERATEEKTPTA